MLRAAASKVMWVGRATVFLVGLAVILALVVGLASAALAGSGIGGVFNLGKNNTVNALTKLTGTVTGSSLVIDNNSTGSAATALNLQVEPGKAPMKVNSTTKVGNLNADLLDGKDSSAFGIETVHNWGYADECDTPNTFNECAPIEVTVPAGKTYLVSVWSSFTASGGSSNQDVTFCSARRNLPGQTTPSCITPFGVQNEVTIEANQLGAAASSGETLPLSEGTYQFSTAINPTAQFADSNYGIVITKVLVRDASGATL